jgi:predicted Zn-dependent protease
MQASLVRRACTLVAAVAVASLLLQRAAGEPYTPQADDEIVERLRERPLDRTDRELRRLRAQLRQSPADLPTAVAVARACVTVARRDGDPRYVGYAEAALAPWWHRADAPTAARLMKAILLQGVHEFDTATEELDAILKADPSNAQAWLTSASIFQVQGRYPDAIARCRRLRSLGATLYADACLAELQSLTGGASQATTVLTQLRAAYPNQAEWLSLIEAEVAERVGDFAQAEARYREALAANPDAYTKGAFADFLLDRNRAREVIDLLQHDQRADPLLLRVAIAYQREHDLRLEAAVSELQARFDAARLRGDTVHRREQARFELELNRHPAEALQLALRNWDVQREPADARILLASARAAGRDAAASQVRAFIGSQRLEDVRLAEYLK